jgi:hypothetical protein
MYSNLTIYQKDYKSFKPTTAIINPSEHVPIFLINLPEMHTTVTSNESCLLLDAYFKDKHAYLQVDSSEIVDFTTKFKSEISKYIDSRVYDQYLEVPRSVRTEYSLNLLNNKLFNDLSIYNPAYLVRRNEYKTYCVKHWAVFKVSSQFLNPIYSPIWCMMVKREYVPYLKLCALTNSKPKSEVFEFWVDSAMYDKSGPHEHLRVRYNKTIGAYLKAEGIEIIKKSNFDFMFYKCTPSKFSTIKDMEEWRKPNTEEALAHLKLVAVLKAKNIHLTY